MRGCLAALALVCAFLLLLIIAGARPAWADHCPDWAAACAHPWAGDGTVAAPSPRSRRGQRYTRDTYTPAARRSVATRGMPAPLVSAIAGVQRACPGFRVISGYRRGARVRGSGRASLHASNRAADIAGGDFGCAYGVLAGFAGGMTTDAHRVRPPHIHLSWAPESGEFGRRFAHSHGRPGRHAQRVRLARR